jgi:transposase-like protein
LSAATEFLKVSSQDRLAPHVDRFRRNFDEMRSKCAHGASTTLRSILIKHRFTCANDHTASVRAEGVEPSRSFEQWHLKPSCLPFHHARSGADRTARRFEKTCRRFPPSWVDHGGERGKQVRPAQEFAIVQRLIAGGLNNCAIARQTGVPRRTVSDWRRRPPVRSRDSGELPCKAHNFDGLRASAYSYSLGVLGRWVHLTTHPARVASEDHPRQEVSGDHRSLLRRHRHTVPQATCIDLST